MDPNVPSYPTIAPKVADDFQKACQSFPVQHLIKPYNNEEISGKKKGQQQQQQRLRAATSGSCICLSFCETHHVTNASSTT